MAVIMARLVHGAAAVALAAMAAAQSTLPPLEEHICARENHVCHCNGYVRYGHGSTFTPQRPVNGSIACNNGIFGDPLVGTGKECRCSGTGIFGITVNVFPSTYSADFGTRPMCGQRYNDQCCDCALTSGADLCSNATGCSTMGGSISSGYTCASCPCKNPGVGCMMPTCYRPTYQIQTSPNSCTRVGNLNVFVKGSCSSTYNASMQPVCPLPAQFVYNRHPPYPGTSTNQRENFCNYMASPTCAPAFCTSSRALQCQTQCNALTASPATSYFNVTRSIGPVLPPPSTSRRRRRRVTPAPTGRPGPSDACITTTGGLCFTDGLSIYANNERCSIRVVQDTVLRVISFSTESGYDTMTVNGVRYSGTHGPDNVTVRAGSRISWYSDASITRGGYLICAAIPPTPPPPGAASGSANFYSSSTCTESTRLSYVAMGVQAVESACQYGPFQSASLYPVTTMCGVPQAQQLPATACNNNPTCSGRGTCNVTASRGSGTCVCNPGYSGLACTTMRCPNNCTGYGRGGTRNGNCVAPAIVGNPPVCNCTPPYYGYTCGAVRRTIASTVNTSYTYRAFARLLSAAPSVVTTLNSTQGHHNYTLLAPSNAAIAALPRAIANFLVSSTGQSALTQILQYHILQDLPPPYLQGALGQESTLLQGSSLTLATTPATVFTLTSASHGSGCAVTTFNSHQCITEGAGQYSNNERCTWSVSASVSLTTPDGFQTEAGYDVLTVGTASFSGTTGPSGRYVRGGSNITWRSDYSITYNGFLVCARTTPVSTTISTNTGQVANTAPCNSATSYCNNALVNGYIRTIDAVLLPQSVLNMLPSIAPTTAAPARPPSLFPTPHTCTIACDMVTTRCGPSGRTCVCLPGYSPHTATTCTFTGTTPRPVTSTTLIDQAALLRAAMNHAVQIQCSSVVRGNTTGGINVIGNSGADVLYRFHVGPQTPQPVWFTTCDNYTNFDTYLRVYAQRRNSTAQMHFVELARNDDDYACNLGYQGPGHVSSHLASNVSLTLRPGNYYILVEGFSSNTGSYALHTHCGGSGAPAPPTSSSSLRCIRQSFPGTTNRFYYRYGLCCRNPGDPSCGRHTAVVTCPQGKACNTFSGCLPGRCSCGTSTHPGYTATNCITDSCYNTSMYGMCGVPPTAAPTPAPTMQHCANGNHGCHYFTSYCGNVSGQARCICRNGFVPPNHGSGLVLPQGQTSCVRAPQVTTMTSTTTTIPRGYLLQQAYYHAPVIACGHNYSGTSGNRSLIGRHGNDYYFRLYVSSRNPQPITLTTCSPHTSFDTVLSVYHQQLDAITNSYRYSLIDTNDDMYPRCSGGTSLSSLASSITRTLPPGSYLVNVEGYSTSAHGTFTLAVECGPGYGPTPPPSPAPPADLGCTRISPQSPWVYRLCSLYGGSTSSLPCPSGSTCHRVSSSTQCIPISCECNQLTGGLGSCQDTSTTQCRSHSSVGICLQSIPPPTTPAPTYAPCNGNPLNCDLLTTSCVVIPPGATSGMPAGQQCICLPGFAHLPHLPSTTCVRSVQSTTPGPASIATPDYTQDTMAVQDATAVGCGV